MTAKGERRNAADLLREDVPRRDAQCTRGIAGASAGTAVRMFSATMRRV